MHPNSKKPGHDYPVIVPVRFRQDRRLTRSELEERRRGLRQVAAELRAEGLRHDAGLVFRSTPHDPRKTAVARFFGLLKEALS